MLGWDKGFSVNSAEGNRSALGSAERVIARFPESEDRDGRLTEAQVRSEIGIGPSGSMPVIGRVSLRKVLELLGPGRRSAHSLIDAEIVNGTIHVSPRGLPFASIQELEQIALRWHTHR
jgi:hypothetical protein